MGDKKGRRSRSASDCRRAQEKWEEAVGKFCQGDLEKRANVEEICSWFPSLQMFIDHGRGLIKVLTGNEKKSLFGPARGVVPVQVFLWAMNEAENSPDPRQRARWYMYRSRRRAPPIPVPDLVGVLLAVPAPVDQSNVHSDSDVEQRKDDSDSEDVEHSEDESDSEDVEQSKDESGEEEVVLLLDDSAGEEEQDDVVQEQPADVQIVGPGIPQLGDRTMPIEAETYIRMGIRHSERISKLKDKKTK